MDLEEETTAATWRRILDPASGIGCRVADRGGEIVGFAVIVLHEGSWVIDPICYLEDLYVDPAARGSGIGRALIEDLLKLGIERGWSRFYWHTRDGNEAARRLYDRFATADGFVRYVIPLE
jgi:ribosomal protein S18 acetylase RimI-like enzyme